MYGIGTGPPRRAPGAERLVWRGLKEGAGEERGREGGGRMPRLTLTVRLPDGTAAAGARVQLDSIDGAEKRTDASGRAVFARVPARPHTVFINGALACRVTVSAETSRVCTISPLFGQEQEEPESQIPRQPQPRQGPVRLGIRRPQGRGLRQRR